MTSVRRIILICFPVLFVASDALAERKVYVTPDNYTGSQAASACAEGYHFASIVELYDFSALIWDSALGELKSDSGNGIPVAMEAWVRSGIDGDDATVNCSGWTSDDPAHRGLWAYVRYDFQNPNGVLNLRWEGAQISCDTEFRVYCISDPAEPIAPEVIYCSGFESCPAQ